MSIAVVLGFTQPPQRESIPWQSHIFSVQSPETEANSSALDGDQMAA
jgi:hypothetical protein